MASGREHATWKVQAKEQKYIRVALLGIAAVLLAGMSDCRDRAGADLEQVQQMPQKPIEQVQEEYTDQWMAIPGVEGTAIGLFEGKPCIKILTSLRPDQLRDKIPSSVEGYRVIIEETGAFRALDQE